MENCTRSRKRNNEEISDKRCKRTKNNSDTLEDESTEVTHAVEYTAGKIIKVRIRNFMCHEALEVTLNENINFIVGRNGSGKSAILTALTVGLGARANVTNRGTSVKKFIKVGQTSATIEITLTNKGDLAYKPDIYGDIIVVIRTIGPTSSYKIKNWRGEIISTKRDELDNIMSTMNVQVDNPISVLNQDVSRTFLVTSKPEEKYNLFMKATLLDAIENNYLDALEIIQEENTKLKHYYETLLQVKAEIQKLKDNIHKVEQMDESRAKLANLEEYELPWAIAIAEETKLNKIQENLTTYETKLKELQKAELSVETKTKGIDEKITKIREKILQAEQERNDSFNTYNSLMQKYNAAKEVYSSKQRELRAIENKIKRQENDIALLQKEIQKIESSSNEESNERKELTEKLTKFEEKLNEVETMMRTRQTELMHLEADNVRLSQEKQTAKFELDNCSILIRKLERDLKGFEQQSDNMFSVFGPNIPRLLRRIEEEFKKGRFKEKPRGPIGAYIKMNDEAWAPAVESYLGHGMLNSFCVDNSQDAKLLTCIMKEIFHNERLPQIITSKFYHRVHDVSRYCTLSPQYSNLLQAMTIEDSIVVNCLIDQREIECILLIPTNHEACEIMSNASRVPKNCKRAFTQQGDMYFPDPNYRTYGGKCGSRAKYLQVSTREALQSLKEELETAENKRREAKVIYTAACEKETQTKSALNNVSATVMKCHAMQKRCKEEIDNLKDKLDSSKASSSDVFRNELTELEKKLTQERATEKTFIDKVQQLQENLKSLDEEVKRCRSLKDNVHIMIDPLRDEIKELTQEKNRHCYESQRSTRRLEEFRQAVQAATGEFQIQERATKIAVDTATAKCPRINTNKSIKAIKATLTELRDQIREIEHEFGCMDELRKRLKEKEEKYGMNIEVMTTLKQSCERHIERVKNRYKVFLQLRKENGVYIQKTFDDVLALRQYKGFMAIDHDNKTLDLNVSVRNDATGKDTRSLSGGERSYSTVAFILAMWECVKLPFYFLDEFDVFMDKVNRRVIMDILLDHARLHPESQFCFLTPLDTSHILTEDCVTIHRLQPPERRGLSQ